MAVFGEYCCAYSYCVLALPPSCALRNASPHTNLYSVLDLAISEAFFAQLDASSLSSTLEYAIALEIATNISGFLFLVSLAASVKSLEAPDTFLALSSIRPSPIFP